MPSPLSSKPSRSERQSRRAFLRWSIAGGAALVVGTGVMVAGMRMMGPPVLEGNQTLAQRLSAAGIQDKALRLLGEGDPDVVIVGSSDCVHCRNFVAEGLDGFLDTAARQGMVVDYLAVPTGPGSIVSTRATGCFLNARDPVAAVRATYRLSMDVTQGMKAETIPVQIQTLMDEVGARGNAATCWSQTDDAAMGKYAQDLVAVLPLQGTPGFFVAQEGNPGVIRQFSGYGGADVILRQLATARAN